MVNEKLLKIPLSFYSKETSELTFKHQKKNLAEIMDLYHIWYDLYVILNSKYSGSAFSILNVETTANIEASMFLAINGYYRQAITLLRCWLETGLYSLYFHEHPVEFNKWSLGSWRPKQIFMLNFDELLTYIFQFQRFNKFNQIFKKRSKGKKIILILRNKSLRERIELLYGELSAHVHGRGFYRSSLGAIPLKGKFRIYSKDSFLLWKILFETLHNVLIISYLLYDPKLLNRFPSRRKRILDALPENMKKILIQEFNVKY